MKGINKKGINFQKNLYLYNNYIIQEENKKRKRQIYHILTQVNLTNCSLYKKCNYFCIIVLLESEERELDDFYYTKNDFFFFLHSNFSFSYLKIKNFLKPTTTTTTKKILSLS